jgi:hypothetical protein
MADALYPKSKAQMAKALLDLSTITMRAYLLDGTYVYSAAHEFLSDVGAGTRVARTNPLSGKTVNLTTAAFDSDDPTAESVTGDNINQIILYQDTGVEGTSRLIFYKDTGISTIPFTPDGSDIRILVNASGWFKL